MNLTLKNYVKSEFNNIDTSKQYLDFINPSQYIGLDAQVSYDTLSLRLYTKKSVTFIQKKVSEYLIGVDSKNRTIIPSEKIVISVIFCIKKNYRPKEIGDIYGRFLVIDDNYRNDYDAIIDQAISILVRNISTELGMEEHNSKLSIWTTVLGDFNEHGLRSHSTIKIRNKRPDPYLISMRY